MYSGALTIDRLVKEIYQLQQELILYKQTFGILAPAADDLEAGTTISILYL